ncbi:cysteine proteinase [Auriscalpium vulgare]|uniref:Cysteine proteinase n=1 Tax=Auriscalpium vulgare TaxID=40419 RepID=A0ACB8S8D8_9AGAM|nr:cysteine proteinase [Auriscalpium vulgare]
MPLLNVSVKHAGKKYDLVLDTDRPATVFKEAIYQKTGVPVDRMKVMVKGGVLKDDADWKKAGAKEGATFMVIGAAGELPKPPSEPVKFLEDMDESELADALGLPVGLINLGNTCYMSATVQAMRAIPELQSSLAETREATPLTRSLRDLFRTMSNTTGGVLPMAFLTSLRDAVPQFGERTNRGYAQQDAEECWTQLTNRLKDLPGFPNRDGGAPPRSKFVDQYLSGTIIREMKTPEAPDEPPSVTSENVLKIECNINTNTNFMMSGIMDALDTTVVKQSPTLGREATYSVHTRISRLPTYLTVHMVRFTWRRDISKKAKIMRKVKFPTEFDALDLTTPELRAKLLPVARKLGQIESARFERRKVRKRTKAPKPAASADVEMRDGTASVEMLGTAVEVVPVEAETETTAATVASATQADGVPAGEELLPEEDYRNQEHEELEKLVDPSVKADVGASETGLYDLIAIITHKGAAADAGHYIAFVKKTAILQSRPEFLPKLSGGASSSSAPLPDSGDDEDWYKFDDDKVSVFPKDKLGTLDGGGEDSSAYVLVYKSKAI